MLFDPNWVPPIPAKTKKAKKKARKTWRSLMLKAAAILEKEGWITGDLYRPGAGFCVVGALARAEGATKRSLKEDTYYGSKTLDIARHKIEDHLNIGIVEDWNDRLSPASEELVIKTLREIAAK